MSIVSLKFVGIMIHSLLKKVIIIDKRALGQRIRAIRLRLGLTMEDFIERIDNKPGRGRSGTVNNWETGKNAPNKKRLKKIADIGGVTVEYLINGDRSSAAEMRELYDKALHSFANLTKEEKQKINADQIEFSALEISKYWKNQAQNRIAKEQAAINKHPLSIMDLQTYGFLLSLFNLIRIHGTDDQNINFDAFVNIMWQIATGRIKYDKNDVLTNLDKWLSSFPVKDNGRKK